MFQMQKRKKERKTKTKGTESFNEYNNKNVKYTTTTATVKCNFTKLFHRSEMKDCCLIIINIKKQKSFA